MNMVDDGDNGRNDWCNDDYNDYYDYHAYEIEDGYDFDDSHYVSNTTMMWLLI